MLSNRFDEALVLAHRVHRRQLRKGTQVPYVAHVLGVASLVLEYGGSEDEAIAALLHDALEDAPPEMGADGVRRLIAAFGKDVLEIVEHCSDSTEQPKPPWRARKMRYVQSAEHAPANALKVSVADKLHNVRSLVRDYRREGDELWKRFNPAAGKAGTLGYYRVLLELFERRMPGPSVEDYSFAVIELETLVGMKGVWPPGAEGS